MATQLATSVPPGNEVTFSSIRPKRCPLKQAGNKRYSYGLTVSNNKLGINTTHDDLEYTLKTLDEYCRRGLKYKDFAILDRVYETKDRTGGLHVHALVTSSTKVSYKDTQSKNYQFYWRELRTKADCRRWYRYRHKFTREENYQHHIEAQLNRECRL